MRVLPSCRRRLPISAFAGIGSAFIVAACRFSGSDADPYAEGLLDTASGGAGGQGVGGNGRTDITATDATGGASDTGGTGTGDGTTNGRTGIDSGTGGASSKEGGTASPDAGMPVTPSACQPATPPAICDPVKNFGCLIPFSSCDVDTTQVVATGRCVFPWSSTPPTPDAGSCSVNPTTDTCAATSTCVNGTCRKLCYCDANCQPGECCAEPAPGRSKTFRLCKPC